MSLTSVEIQTPSSFERRETWHLMMLFSAMYFVQGIAEPTEGLITQPVRSMLKMSGYSAAAITGFAALLALPWSCKPLYGLLTDFVPIFGTRRRSYLLITSAASCAALLFLYFVHVPTDATWLLLVLLIPTIGVAFSDVIVDALMIEKGQPSGLTGPLQSVQWAAMYGGTIVAGSLGGYLSATGQQREGFLLCALMTGCTFLMTWFYVHEDRTPKIAADRFRASLSAVLATLKNRTIWGVAAFLFLWSFNPFNASVLYLYWTQQLGIGEQFYGFSVSLLSIGAIAGSLSYGVYGRWVSRTRLLHLSIVSGVLSTLAYAFVTDATSAGVVSIFVGFSYMTGSMVQFDLAAKACQVASAGTTFAILMSLSNLSLSISTALGGWMYQDWSARWGAAFAFNLLVCVGALSTCGCWLLFPYLKHHPEE